MFIYRNHIFYSKWIFSSHLYEVFNAFSLSCKKKVYNVTWISFLANKTYWKYIDFYSNLNGLFIQQIKFHFLPILPLCIWDIYIVLDSTLSKLEHIFERAHLERPLPLCRSFLGFLFIATSESRYHLVGKYIFKYRTSMEKQPHFLQEKKVLWPLQQLWSGSVGMMGEKASLFCL